MRYIFVKQYVCRYFFNTVKVLFKGVIILESPLEQRDYPLSYCYCTKTFAWYIMYPRLRK